MGSLNNQGGNEFADGDPANSFNVVLNNNLYWNGGEKIPDGDLLSPLEDDNHRFIANPDLGTDFDSLILPVWDGAAFADGNTRIRDEFLYLAQTYGSPSSYSPAIRTASPDCAPKDDIFRQPRGFFPSFGADQRQIDQSND
jgi:hypothetical protein